MTSAYEYKVGRRQEARRNKKCTMCLKRKARVTKNLLTCGPCSRAAGIRRDAIVVKRKMEAVAKDTQEKNIQMKEVSKTPTRTVQNSRRTTRTTRRTIDRNTRGTAKTPNNTITKETNIEQTTRRLVGRPRKIPV